MMIKTYTYCFVFFKQECNVEDYYCLLYRIIILILMLKQDDKLYAIIMTQIEMPVIK